MTNATKAFFSVFATLIAFMIWSLAYGGLLAFLYHDPRILKLTLAKEPLAPLIQLWRFSGNAIVQQIAALALVPSTIVAGLFVYYSLRQRPEPLGDAAFQTVADLRNGKWFRRDGHIFGRLGSKILRSKDDRHHLVIGPTRSGKGAGYVIPNALMHEGSMIVTDLKGEIFNATAGYRQAKGNQVFLFSPGEKETHRWNPMDFIREDLGNRTKDIQNMAAILVPANAKGDGKFWQEMAQQIAAGLISYINESDYYTGRRHLGEINSLLNSGKPLQVLLKFILEKEPYLSKFTRESFNSYIGLPEKTAGSAITELQVAMKPFRNERIIAATQVTDIDLRSLNVRPMSIYLAPNITDITLLSSLLTLFVQQVMNLLTLKHNPKSLPVYFLLDEFRQLKKMDEIMNKLPYVAGYNIKLAFIIQDLKSVDEIYGETSRHSLLGNCGYQLILGANDQATADYVSRALGKRTVRYQSESRAIELVGLHRRTKVEQIRERELMMPQEVRKMASDKFVLLVEGQSPINAKKLRFFETAPFKSAEIYSKANRPSVPEVDLLPAPPVPALSDGYGAEVEVVSDKATEIASPTLSETVEIITEDGEIIEVPKPVALASEPVAFNGEAILELKVLAAKSEVAKPLDLFGQEVEAAASKAKTRRKRLSLEELKQAVVLDPL